MKQKKVVVPFSHKKLFQMQAICLLGQVPLCYLQNVYPATSIGVSRDDLFIYHLPIKIVGFNIRTAQGGKA